MKIRLTLSFAVLVIMVVSSHRANAGESSRTLDPALDSRRIVTRHRATFQQPSTLRPASAGSTAMLLGNGTIAASIGGPPELQRVWFHRNDFWRFKSHAGQGYFTGIGHLDVNIPELKGAAYEAEQTLHDAKTTARFVHDEGRVTMVTYVAAEHPLVIIELTAEGRDVGGTLAVRAVEGGGSRSVSGQDGELRWFTREFAGDVDIPSGAAVVLRHYGGDASTLELPQGETVRIAVAMSSLFEARDYLSACQAILAAPIDFRAVDAAHRAWWADYWSKCVVEIGDPVLEQRYYLSNYVMGSASRSPEFPPSIFGPWVGSDQCSWSGDYHLNYNYQAPFYGLYSCNHLEQSMPYHAPILAAVPRGKYYARKYLNCRGVYFGVGIGPKGMETTRYRKYGQDEGDGLWMGQKSNAAYTLVNMAFHWYSTYDRDYAETVYPVVLEVAEFWEDYLTWESFDTPQNGRAGRYVIENDSIHENSGPDFNPLLSLGLVRNTYELALSISKELGLDAGRHERWGHILDHLSDFPTQERNGKTVFRYAERGTPWWNSNGLGIQHIYPGNALGLDSDPKLLEIARNTVTEMDRWIDGNCMSSFYPAAVRVGYDGSIILSELTDMIQEVGQENGFIRNNPHGIENCSIVPNTINMMLCMGHGHVLRVFPAWPRNRDARFSDLRVWGAFLVSSELKDGEVRYVQIRSEKGRPCTVQNPWPGDGVQVFRGGARAETASGDRFTLQTETGEAIRLAPIEEED